MDSPSVAIPQALMNCPASPGRPSLRSAPCVNRGRCRALVETGEYPPVSSKMAGNWRFSCDNNLKICKNYETSLYMEVYSWETQSMIGKIIRAVVAKLVLLMIIGYYITFWMIIVQMSDGFIW